MLPRAYSLLVITTPTPTKIHILPARHKPKLHSSRHQTNSHPLHKNPRLLHILHPNPLSSVDSVQSPMHDPEIPGEWVLEVVAAQQVHIVLSSRDSVVIKGAGRILHVANREYRVIPVQSEDGVIPSQSQCLGVVHLLGQIFLEEVVGDSHLLIRIGQGSDGVSHQLAHGEVDVGVSPNEESVEFFGPLGLCCPPEGPADLL